MSAFLDDVARASLPVAVVLLCFAAVARAAIWAPIEHAGALRAARQYLEPLCTWCLVALVTYAVAVGGAGRGLMALVPPLVLAFVAVLLRPAGEPAQAVEPAAEAPSGADDPAPRQGLWSR
jgi:hypothetical protein